MRIDCAVVRVGVLHFVRAVRPGKRFDSGAGCQDLAAIAGGFDQTLDPAFKSITIDDDEPGLRDHLGVSGRGLVDVGIGVQADQGV